MNKRKMFVYQQTRDNPMSCIENVVYSYVYFRMIRFSRRVGLTTRQVSKGTGMTRTQTVSAVLTRLEDKAVAYREDGLWLLHGVPDDWYRKRRDGKRMFMMVQVPKPNTLTLKQNLVYWKLCDLQRIYGEVKCVGGVWLCGRRKTYRASGIAKILGIDKATVLRSARGLAEMGLLDGSWNLVSNPPDMWRDSSSIVEAKAKPEAKKRMPRTYKHPESQAKWEALSQAGTPFELASQIADLDVFFSLPLADVVEIIRSADKLLHHNLETGKAKVNHPGYLILDVMRKKQAKYEENQQRYCPA